MITALVLMLLSQSTPAVRRSTPAADDLGMVVRQAGAVTVTCTNCASGGDGGISTVSQGAGQDGGAWNVAGTVGVSNPVTYVNALVDGGVIQAVQGVGIDGGRVWAVEGQVAVTNFPASQAVTGPLTDTQLRATPVPVSGTITATVAFDGGAVTAFQGTSPWVVSGTVTTTSNPYVNALIDGGTVTVNNIERIGGVLVGSVVPIGFDGGLVTALQGTSPWVTSLASTTITGSVAVTGPLTDTQLRATPVPVSGTVTANAGTNLNTSALALDATLTNRTQLTKVTDGTNDATVKAASAAAVATDKALVVAVSPNNTIAATQSGTWTNTVTQATGTNLHTITDTGSTTAVTGTVAVAGTVTANAGTNLNTSALSTSANQTALGAQTTKINDGTNTAAVKPASTAASATDPALVVAISPNNTLPISGTVAVTQSTSPWVTSLASTTITGSVAVTGPLTDTQLRATPVPVSGTVTANAGTNLNTSALALSATQTDRTQRSQITDGTRDGTVKAASTAAAATDTALVVAVSPNNTVAVLAASLPLPSGAATSANQTALGSQTTKLNDGTNSATVKAASTAAVATDTALVVAISPNNSLSVSNPSVGATGAAPPASAGLSGGSVTTTAPTYTTGQMNALSLDTAGNLRVATSVAALFQTIAISAAGNTGTISQALSLGNILVPWSGARTGPAVLTIPAAANSGNELVVFDQANNAGAFPITVTPVSGTVTGIAVVSRNRGTVRLLDSAGGFGWVVIE
jgi:hypothetical protein